jgi:hypothetical protein
MAKYLIAPVIGWSNSAQHCTDHKSIVDIKQNLSRFRGGTGM